MFPPLPEPSQNVEQDSEDSEDPEDIENIEVCELNLVHFFTGRNLVSQKAADQEHINTHEKNYTKELKFDEADTKFKGKIMLKKYRKDNINSQSKCDSQYVNNLHTYYGDGSKLKPVNEQHYAMDFINPHGNETEDQTKLRKLEVIRSKKSVENWVNKYRRQGFMHSLRRRSRSCCPEFESEVEAESKAEIQISESAKPPNSKSRLAWDKFATIFNVDKEFELSAGNLHQFPWEVNSNICRSTASLISRVNAFDYCTGRMEIGKVLFSTDKLMAYVIPKRFDTMVLLKKFSAAFLKWFSGLSVDVQKTFGTDKGKFQGRSNNPSRPYFAKVNVVLSLSEFEAEGTMFRRARHVCQIPNSHPSRDIFLEIDTGMLRVVETSEKTVRRMPQEFAHLPTPILECRFEGVTTKEEVTQRIEEIRRTGFMQIGSFDTGNRSREQTSHFQGPSTRKWSDLETAVILPQKSQPSPRITTLFCGEQYCMGLCCTEKYLEKSEISPSTMSIPSAWVADKREMKQRFFGEKEPPKLKHVPAPTSTYRTSTYQPRTTSRPSQPATNPDQPSTSTNPPSSSLLQTEDASDFFK